MLWFSGLIYGAAIGDALGVATCCMTADECQFHYSTDNILYRDIVRDEVRVRWKQGDWTSNFDTLVNAFSLSAKLNIQNSGEK